MEYYISTYGDSDGRQILLDRLRSVGWYAVRLNEVWNVRVGGDPLTPNQAAFVFRRRSSDEDSNPWGKDFSLQRHIKISAERIEWTHDQVLELAFGMLHDSEPSLLIDETLKQRHWSEGTEAETRRRYRHLQQDFWEIVWGYQWIEASV